MREISCGEITECICKMCIQAAHFLSPDMENILQQAKEKEIAPLGKQILQQPCFYGKNALLPQHTFTASTTQCIFSYSFMISSVSPIRTIFP